MLIRRLMVVLAVLAAVVTVPSGVVAGATAAPGPEGRAVGGSARVEAGLADAAADGGVRVIAATTSPGDQVVDDVTATVPAHSIRDVSAGAAHQVVATVDATGLDALARVPGVTAVVEDKLNRVSSDTWPATVGVPAAHTAGWNGSGRTIAVLDAGVEAGHPFLGGRVTAQACFSTNAPGVVSLCNDSQLTEDHGSDAAKPCVGIVGCTHGTHVAGLAAGGTITSPIAITGTATGASVIAVKVFSKGTTSGICGGAPPCLVAYDSDIVDALTWLKSLKDGTDTSVPSAATLDAVNLSLGGGLYSATCDMDNPSLTAAIEGLRGLGVVTVAAAGNNGSRGSISSPACISTVVSVAATTGGTPNAVASFSNLSSFTTILAPGYQMTSSIPSSTYGTMSGTSMATPVVSGSIAAVREELPGATASDVVALLRSTGSPLGGIPELQLDAALVGVPSDVQQLTAAPGNSSVVLSWVPPSSTGTSSITSYTVTASPGGGSCSTSTTSCTVSGLSNGTTYSFLVTATNAAGAGAGTGVSATPAGPPSAPTGPRAVAGDRQATVSWTAPSSTGGAPLTGYVATASPGGQTCSVGAAASSCVVGGLANGVGTTFTVVASNGAGPGTPSVATTAVVPKRAGNVPFGAFDSAVAGVGTISVSGWAIDPDTASPIAVHVYVDSYGTAISAGASRPDVDAAFGYGAAHGFGTTVTTSGGVHTVCAYGINDATTPGANVLLGCRTVAVPSGPPFGSLDVVAAAPGSVTVGGWAIDPDTSQSIPVHVYVDSTGVALTANGWRGDVAGVFAGYGPAHGFTTTMAASAGAHTVCAYGINVGLGANSLLGCRVVTVPGGPPFGAFDAASRGPGGTVTVAGWAIDPDTTDPIPVHVYVVGPGFPVTGVPLTAGVSRSDLAAAFPAYGGVHGFSATVLSGVPAGSTVCAYGINVGVGANVVLGCKVVP